MDFIKIQKVSKSEEVIEYLKEQIVSRKIAPGERLPVEEALAENMGVGRGTVREALRVLVHLGLVERRNNGTYVTENSAAKELQIEPSMYRDLIEVMEVRLVVEPAMAEFAAQRGDQEMIDKIGEELEAMRERNEDVESFLLHDTIFHDFVSNASGNMLFRNFLSGFSSLMSKNQEIVLKERFEHIMPKSLSFHEKIYNAIREGNGMEASRQMKKHIMDVEHEFNLIYKDNNGGLR